MRQKVYAVAALAAVSFGATAAWWPFSTAWAQDAQTTDSQKSADTAAADTLQEVVVTAERRAEDVQSTPIAVTAVTGDTLREQNVSKVGDLSQVAPALSVSNQGSGYVLINMRGVGNNVSQAPITTGVPMILDGMNNPRGTGSQWPMFDIADVEVLRGPQGTFVGSNSTGGAIEVNSANPNFRGVNGYAELQAGNYHDNLVEAAVNLPITDTFAMRVALHTEVENSFSSNQGVNRQEIPYASQAELDPGNMDERSVRVSAIWKPTNNFQFLFKVQYDENNTDGIGYNVNPATFAPLTGVRCPFLTAPNGQCYSEYYGYYSGNPRVFNSGLPFEKFEYWDRFYTGEARYTFSNGDVVRLFAGQEGVQTPGVAPTCYCSAPEADGYSLGGFDSAEPETNSSVELDLISPSRGRLQWTTGATTTYSDGVCSGYFLTAGPPPNTPAAPTILTLPCSEVTRQVGVFGHVTFQITPTLQLEAGLRGNWDSNFGTGIFQVFPGGTYTCASPCGVPSTPPLVKLNVQGQYKSNHQTDKFGFNWQATENEFLYAFYARGYAPGVTQVRAFTTTEANAVAETLNDFEVGWKGTFLSRHLTTQLDGYWDNYYEMQQVLFNPNFPNNGGIANVPRATIKGFEANMQLELQHFGASIAAAYTNSRLAPLSDVASYKFPAGVAQSFGAYLPPCPAGAASSTTCFQYAPYITNLGGEEDPYAPELTVNATVQYAIQIGNAALQPRLQFSHMDKQYASVLQTDPYYEMGPRNIFNAYLDFMDGAWRTTIYGTNLSNDLYETTNNGTTVAYGAPRQFGVQTTRTF